MSEWRTFKAEFRAPKSDVVVLLTTFLLTVLVDLTVAIEVGMVLAAFLFMRRMAEVVNISVLTHEFRDPTDDFENDPNAVRRSVSARGRGLRDHGSVLLRRGGDAAGPARRHRRPSPGAHHPP